jgi:hypothetical protein
MTIANTIADHVKYLGPPNEIKIHILLRFINGLAYEWYFHTGKK